ncbi:MAG: hypothetical protein MJY41_04350 [Bacteroidales bacterium]|nr:hypothetical protein [Bacteroidales bacterium]
MVDSINIKELNLSELAGVITAYPWYGGARRELCERMCKAGAWSDRQYAEASLYLGSHSIITDIVRSCSSSDYSDKNVEQLLKDCLEDAPGEALTGSEEPGRQIFVVGGDYFTPAQYNKVRRDTDGVFSSFAVHDDTEDVVLLDLNQEEIEFCTEPLAEIYAEQGYFKEARDIYSKLMLRYPEKSAYFAALIEKIDNK